ncbi:class GN sortase [Hephaestia mangrovi]|uniref:class GN sortase n=1 Tax=Hephaestia mangrovi TaxID=2873268 RepID=UPI001CA75484|nr:class GN sortase [Hephaestia mangrovi]MBY8829692.1 class GN sortase [Hephaestia mangrovi]
MAARALPKGRVFGRGLAATLLIALSLAGIARIAAGAIVPAKAVVAQILLEHAFDRSVARHHSVKPWPWADMAPVARISVSRLGVDRIVLDTGSGQAMAFGPTLLPAAARIGEPGTAVIAAHRDTHFRFLQHVRKGDVIVVEGVGGRTRRYVVTGAEIVRWDRFAIATGGGQQLALATCYPFGATRHGPSRYVVHAVRVGAKD